MLLPPQTLRLLSKTSSTAYELAKDIGQDASVQVIVDFDWSIYPEGNWSLHGSAARSVNNCHLPVIDVQALIG